MSEHRQRIDPITAEHLLRGERATGPDPLADLLAAAAHPAHAAELTGEDGAVMAFRDAHLPITPQLRRRSMLKSALAKAATAKAVVAIAALGGGGVALAAGSGHLPGGTSTHEHAAARPSTSATAREHNTHSAPAGSASASEHASARPSATPSPNLRGLCTAFNAGVGDNPGKALDNPAFSVLINAAGGKDKVTAYCTTVLGSAAAKPTHPGGGSSTHPGGRSSTHPGGGSSHSSDHPTGAPSTRPSEAPTTHPSGPPTSHPVPTMSHTPQH